MNGNKVLVAASTDDNCGIRIGSNMVIAGNGQIDICPHGKSLSGGDNFFPGETNRIKLGGQEYVSNTDNTEDVIFSYKPANSEGEIIPFAITESGEAYYKGREIANSLYHHVVTIDRSQAGYPTYKIYINFYRKDSTEITKESLWDLLDGTDTESGQYDQQRIDATGLWNNFPALGFAAIDEEDAYRVYFFNAPTSAYAYNQIAKDLTGYTVTDFVTRII